MSQRITQGTESDAFLTAILQASNFNQLQVQTRKALTALNLDELMLRTSTVVNGKVVQCHLFGTLPASLLKLFEQPKLLDDDPVDIHFSRSSLPFIWEPESFCGEKQETYIKLKEHGIRWGMSVMVRGERTVGRIDFYNRFAVPDSAKLKADLHLLGLYLTEVTRTLLKRESESHLPVLTPREKECLYWTAAGKTTLEVGMILRISSHTASFHLKNAAAKLNVYGTRHAITRALAMGIIQPVEFS